MIGDGGQGRSGRRSHCSRGHKLVDRVLELVCRHCSRCCCPSLAVGGAAGRRNGGGRAAAAEDAAIFLLWGLRDVRLTGGGGWEHGRGICVPHVAGVGCKTGDRGGIPGGDGGVVVVRGECAAVGGRVSLCRHGSSAAVGRRIGRVGGRARVVGARSVVVEREVRRRLVGASRGIVGGSHLGWVVGGHHAGSIVRRGSEGGWMSHNEGGVDPRAQLRQGVASGGNCLLRAGDKHRPAGGRGVEAGRIGGNWGRRGDRVAAAERLRPDGDAAVGRVVPCAGGGAGGGGEEGGVGGGGLGVWLHRGLVRLSAGALHVGKREKREVRSQMFNNSGGRQVIRGGSTFALFSETLYPIHTH